VPVVREEALAEPPWDTRVAALQKNESLANAHTAPKAIGIFQTEITGFTVRRSKADIKLNWFAGRVEPGTLQANAQKEFDILPG